MKKLLFALSLSLLFCGCNTVTGSFAQEGIAVNKKIVMIIPEDKFRDEELLQPQDIFTRNGADVSIASTTTGKVKGMLGAEVVPDTLLRDLDPLKFDAVVFVGGQGASQYWNDPVAQQIAVVANNSNRIVGAICIAPVTLAHAGILKGKRATVYSSEKQQLIDAGAEYTGRQVERDGNIITASGPSAAGEFAQEITRALNR